MKVLSSKQELKLINYLDEQLLILSRQYELRNSTNGALTSLPLYLSAILQLLSVILPIPPIKSSSSLRISYSLKLTSLLSDSFLNYSIEESNLNSLWSTLKSFDKAWIIILTGKNWNDSISTSSSTDIITTREPEITGTDLVRLNGIIQEIILVLGEVLGIEKVRNQVQLNGEVQEPNLDFDMDSINLAEEDEEEEEEETPSLMTTSSMDEDENDEEDEEDDEDDFEEVEIPRGVGGEEETFNIQVEAPLLPTEVEIFDLPIQTRRGFDPDEEYKDEIDEDENENEEEMKREGEGTDEFIEEEIENVFRGTIAILVEFRKNDELKGM